MTPLENHSRSTLRVPTGPVHKSRVDLLQNKVARANLSDHDLSGRSILADFIPVDPVDDMKLLMRALTNICLASSAKNLKGFVGMKDIDSIAFIHQATKYISQNGLFGKSNPQILEACQQLHTQLSDTKTSAMGKATAAMGMIENLQPNESYSIYTGWSKFGRSHAMLLRFYRRMDLKLDIFVYNAQKGAEKIQGGRKRLGKTITQPYLKFEGVPDDVLFLAKANPQGSHNPLILENIFEIGNPHLSTYMVSAHTLISFLNPLAKYLAPGRRLPQLFMAVQPSGNCTIKSFNCLLLDLACNANLYKRETMDLRLYTLMMGYHMLNRHPEWPQSDRECLIFMLQQATQNFLDLVKHNEHKLERESFITAVATGREIVSKLAFMQQELSILKSCNFPAEVELAPQLRKEASERKKEIALIKFAALETKKIKRAPPLQSELGKGIEWNRLFNTLRDVSTKLLDQTSIDRILQFEALIQNLRHLKTNVRSLNKMTYNDSIVLLKELETAFDLYFDSVIGKKATHSRKFHNTMMEVLALSYCLSLHADRLRSCGNHAGYLSEFGIDTFLLREVSLFDGYDIHDPIVLAHRNELLHFFSSLGNGSKKLFDFIDGKCNIEMIVQGKTAESDYFLNIIPDLVTSPGKLKEYSIEEAEKRAKLNVLFLKMLCESHGFLNSNERIIHSWINGLPHFFHLKRMALKCAEITIGASNDGWKRPTSSSSISNENQIHHTTRGTGWKQPLNDKMSCQECAKNPSVDTKSFRECFKASVVKHTYPAIPSENTYIVRNSNNVKEQLGSVLRAMTEPGAMAPILLEELTIDPAFLLKPENRVIMDYLIHKTMDRENRTESPLFAFLAEDPFFILRLNRLTEVAQSKWRGKQETERDLEEIHASLLVLRLRSELLLFKEPSIASDPYLSWVEELLETMDKIEGCPNSLKNEALSVKALMLMNGPQEASQMADLFVTMAMMQKVDIEVAQNIEARRRYSEILPQWRDKLADPTERETFAKAVHAILGYKTGNNQSGAVGGSPLMIKAQDDSGETWDFDLEVPEIAYMDKPWSKGKIAFTPTEEFIRLFKNRLLNYRIIGSHVITFSDEIWGQIRMSLSVPDRGVHRIERQIDGKWYSYLSHRNCERADLNSALRYDHSAWISNDPPNHLMISDLETGELMYTTDDSGDLRSVKTGEIFSHKLSTSHPVPLLLQRFENKELISFFTDGDQKRSVELPCFL